MNSQAMDRREAEVTYQTLRGLEPAESWVVPPCILHYAEGEVDEAGRLDGPAHVQTAMGFRFDGTFRQGQMAGFGCMRWADGYTVQGHFDHGAANGKGALIWPNGDRYEGHLAYSIRQGVGRLSSHGGRAVYQGAWAHGRRNGRGSQQFPDGNIYDGEWQDDERQGHGVMIYHNGDCYEGDWAHDERHGKGEMAWKKGAAGYTELYEGTWVHGLPSGQGRSTMITYLEGSGASTYNPISESGDFLIPSNFVIPFDCGTNVYEGSFMNGKREGQGIFYYADGSRFEGTWQNGRKNGTCKFIGAISQPFYGTFVDDIPQNLPPLSVPGYENAISSIYIEDLCTMADENEVQVVASTKAILLRFNPWMKSLFRRCCCLQNEVFLITTPDNWWKHRLPGLITMPQLLRFLNDVHILGGVVMVSTVVRCVLDTIHAEKIDNFTTDSPGSIAREEAIRKRRFIDEVHALRANLNYRQFTEVLIRLANVVVVGPSFVTVGQKFVNFIDRLSGNVSVSPLFPQTRAQEVNVMPHLDSLRSIFHGLVELEHIEPNAHFLSVRFLMRFLNPLLGRHGLELRRTICELFPLRTRYSSTSPPQASLPPGFNAPQGDLGFEVFEKASGSSGALDAEVVAGFDLTFEDFVEAVILICLKCCEDNKENPEFHISPVVEREILSLRISDM
ncbi:unnamed protein product [Phytomonas sp. Hart1]|nr:unnamed protein product [Phytomonas sp. Hart1]|eukprot:CCW67660.1 unnamed protein product [Phytomonas sp. isolate Hart1]